MNCCVPGFPIVGGQPGSGGGGAAFSLPGSTWWTFANDGGPSDGIITTTDATPVFRTWATLTAGVGAVNFQAWFYGVSSTGDECLFRQSMGGYGRNAIGALSLLPVFGVLNNGYDETGTGAAPWNNLFVNPAGWGGGVNFEPGGNILQVAFNGAAGQTVQWRCAILAAPFFGGTIQL